jgi:hypothetical protein
MLPAGAPPVLTEVAQRFADTSRGIVAFRMHRTFEAHAGFSSRHEDLVMAGVFEDGSVAKVHVFSYTIDGKAASAAAVSDVEQGWEHPKPGDAFASPFDSRYFDAYQYQPQGAGTIGFTSSVRDAGHGNGSFTFDAQSNVVSYVYQPNALPPHAKWGEISDRRAEVLPGYWAVTEEMQNYKGNVGPFSGTGTVDLQFSGFRRFADLQSATRSFEPEKAQ